MDFLSVITPAGKAFRKEIGPEGLTIGRSSQMDLQLEDASVSRDHAHIQRREEGLYLVDKGGKNGTFLNEKKVEDSAPLHDGDCIRVGSTTLVLNGTPRSMVELVDGPMPVGAATRFLSLEELRSTKNGDFAMGFQAAMPATGGGALRTVAGAAGGESNLSSTGSLLLGIIFEADKQLVFHRPLEEILETIMDLVGRAIPFDRGLLMLREDGRLVPRIVRVPPEEQGRTLSISKTIADRAVMHKESILTADALSDDRFRPGESIVAQQVRSAMCVPLWDDREVRGLIYIDSRRAAGLFTEDHLRLLTHFANVVAVKIENARLFKEVLEAERLAKELEGAAEIQSSLLPVESPPVAGYLIHASSTPCRAVGGDLYDYVELSGGRLGVALGDVAGKGFPAALIMCTFQASFRALLELDLDPEETMVRLNRIMCRRLPMNRFVTFLYAELDPESNRMTFVNAGHCPPWLIRAGGPPERYDITGRPIGMFENSTYEATTIEIRPGDVFVCYSDGVPEGECGSGEQFGEKRLVDLVEEHRDGTPAEIMRRIIEAIDVHHGSTPRQDDITLVVLKRSL